MKDKWTPSILIWQLDLKESGKDEPFQSIYFLTRRGVERFLKKHKKEMEEENIVWFYGGERLWFW